MVMRFVGFICGIVMETNRKNKTRNREWEEMVKDL